MTSPAPHSQTSEKAIEHYFCAQMRLLGLPCIKQFNPYEAGWPDRLVVLPNRIVIWVEFKSKGKKPTALQQHRHKALAQLSQAVFVISTREEAEALVERIRTTYLPLQPSAPITVPAVSPAGPLNPQR